jgi:hypothetical protein
MDHNRIDPHHVGILLNSLETLNSMLSLVWYNTLNHGECILFVSLNDMFVVEYFCWSLPKQEGSRKRDPSPIQKSSADCTVGF